MALALTRKPGESIRIGPDVFVKVVKIRGNQVRLAIEAPEHKSVMRTELDREEATKP
jgi:carbon storage regulator